MASTLPLRQKLPLLISTLLVVVAAAISWLAYDHLERVLLVAASQRIENGASQFSGMLHDQLVRIRRETYRLSHEPSVLDYLAGSKSLAHDRVDSVLAAGLSTTPQLMARTLWSRSGVRLLAVGKTLDSTSRETDASTPSPVPYNAARARSAGEFRDHDGRAFYDVIAPAVTKAGDTLGFVVETRMVVNPTRQNLGELVGPDARVLLGNASGTLWTDQARIVRHPRVGPDAAATTGMLRVTDSIPETPWAVSISMSRRAAVAPARLFLMRAILMALVIIAAGAFAAFLLSRSITRPLDAVTQAAEGIAAGDYTRRAVVHVDGEFGQLARSFNGMAERVAHATTELASHASEAQATARDLESTNAELQRALSAFHRAREESEEASRVREETLALLNVVLASAPVGFALVDADRRAVRVNESMARLSGIAAEAYIGQNVAELQPEFWAQTESMLRAVLEERRTLVDVELVRRDGGVARDRHFRASFFPVSTEEGAPLCVGVFVAETTQQKLLEAQLLQAQRMEAVGQLAGGVAHDFNNLLTVITNYGSMLIADLPPDSVARSDAAEMVEAANRAAGLTRQLLAFSRRQVLQPQVLDVSILAGNLEKMLRRLLREDIELVTQFGPTPHLVYADPGPLEQVLMNLVVNSRDAMPDGGRITIETHTVVVSGDRKEGQGVPPGRYVTLVVDDTGKGMDAATMERIFDPFFTTKPVGKGTGLGLSTAYGIVEQSGGFIRVRSEPGVGSTFTVYLPAADAKPEPNVPAEPCSSPCKRRHQILLVEDELSVRVIARRILESAGYAVVEAANGVEALRQIEPHPDAFALVLTDLVMPEMGGRELAHRLRALRPAPRVLFMSGYMEDATLRRGPRDRAGLFLQKPFTTDSLTRKVSEALA